ncbi:acyltransferase [Anaerocolumna aminovalerica]|uniref:acyltransferase n=1 Tax=Anaerocolumna aminovalerica TaxID=1527 RepID=UPI000BE3E470|nr:acyltransferase family protein [Anaerocolumna aminovalerica]MBU5333423.1 acyltransferase family protein [Anaerocolumna aminovalerica]
MEKLQKKSELQPKKRNRIVYLDILRVLSILCVIAIHGAAGKAQDINALGEPSWWWSNVVNSITRWAVPVFFMISGALTLDSPHLDNIPYFIKSRFLKVGIPFLIWSIIYSLIMEIYILGNEIHFPEILGILFMNILLDKSYYHLWFVYDIFIIYLISPLLKKIVVHSTKKEFEYWLGLWFASTVLCTLIQSLVRFFGGPEYYYVHILNIPFVFGISGYCILGYYLHHHDLSKKLRMVIYIGALASVFLTAFGTYFISLSKNTLNESLYSHFAVTTVTISIAIFIAAKNIDWNGFLTESFQKLLGTLSNATYGIYLIHMVLIIDFSGRLGFLAEKSYAFYTIALIIISFTLSFILVKLIQLIPRVGKYLI